VVLVVVAAYLRSACASLRSSDCELYVRECNWLFKALRSFKSCEIWGCFDLEGPFGGGLLFAAGAEGAVWWLPVRLGRCSALLLFVVYRWLRSGGYS
jgi:hypothetical protein